MHIMTKWALSLNSSKLLMGNAMFVRENPLEGKRPFPQAQTDFPPLFFWQRRRKQKRNIHPRWKQSLQCSLSQMPCICLFYWDRKICLKNDLLSAHPFSGGNPAYRGWVFKKKYYFPFFMLHFSVSQQTCLQRGINRKDQMPAKPMMA